MSQFFRTSDGEYHPVSRIRSYTATHNEGGQRSLTVILNDPAQQVRVDPAFSSMIERAGAPTIPALPRTFFVGLVDDEPNSVWFEDVIAWIVAPDDQALPVTGNGPEGGVANEYAVLHPSGVVTDQVGESHESLKDYFRAKKNNWNADIVSEALQRARTLAGRA